MIRSLDPAQRARAVIHPSIHPADLPDLQHQFDGRQVGGAGNDNVVVPYQGVPATDLTDAQRRLVVELAAVYAGWSAEPHAQVSVAEVEAHLDETWFSWYGGDGDADPFYYRVHSPVVLIEFDHHHGVIFDNDVPSRHHVHAIVRTPNGGDYGGDLLRQHYEQFEHRAGRHEPYRRFSR